MGVLDLHNECPPMNYGLHEAQEVARGLGIGEVATASTLRALADCLLSLASMDDTVNNIMNGWSAAMSGAGGPGLEATGKEIQECYAGSFRALETTIDRINSAVQGYRELDAYAQGAREAGRGEDYEKALVTFGGGFSSLVNSRIERLRSLKVRLKVLKQLDALGAELLAAGNYPEFFLMFMQPFRDMSLAANELYSEVVRGALVSHKAMLNVCQLPGEDISVESVREFLQPVAGAAGGNGEKPQVAQARQAEAAAAGD